MKHARSDYNRIQDPALQDQSLLSPGSTPIGKEEPVFLLRATDKTAAMTVRFWASMQRSLVDGDTKAADLADGQALLMDKWKPQKTADV